MDRWTRIGRKTMNYFRGKSFEYRKDLKQMTYDMKHIQKKSLVNVYNVIVGVTSLGTTLTYLAYNTFWKHKYLDTLILKVGEKQIPLNEELELLAIREWNTAHVARSYKLMGLLRFFVCKGSDIVSVGDLQTRSGVDIGLPHNFTYNTIDDVKLSEVSIFGQSLKDSKMTEKERAMKKLIESLVLSENAKRFAITREIHFADNYRVVTEALNIMFSTMAAVGVGQSMILAMNLRRKYILSLIFRICSLVLGIGVWFLIRQLYTYDWNKTADVGAVEQGNDYYEGAIEYYQKIMQRNAALYQLLGSEGPKRYTKNGEPKGLFTSVPSLEKRLKNINEFKEEMDSKSNENNNESNDSETIQT